MQCTTETVRKRIDELDHQILTLQRSARRNFTRAIAQVIAARQAECVGYRLLLWSRRAQVHQAVVDLACWRDGSAVHGRQRAAHL
jgi:chorismate mutase